MKTAVLVLAAALVLGVGVPPAGADEPQAAGLHRSTGLVVRVDAGLGRVVMKVNGHVHALAVTKATVLRNDWGEPLAGLRALHVGDYVREECVAGPEGKLLARKIELLRPAWRELESPEW
jgi:hypothetical protein